MCARQSAVPAPELPDVTLADALPMPAAPPDAVIATTTAETTASTANLIPFILAPLSWNYSRKSADVSTRSLGATQRLRREAEPGQRSRPGRGSRQRCPLLQAEQKADPTAFTTKYGTFGKCVATKAKA